MLEASVTAALSELKSVDVARDWEIYDLDEIR
jgi:hypothetical protein